jgi:presequence protease
MRIIAETSKISLTMLRTATTSGRAAEAARQNVVRAIGRAAARRLALPLSIPFSAIPSRRPAPGATWSPSDLAAYVPASHPAFVLVRSEVVEEHAAVASLYRHTATGAELLSVACGEGEKVFGAAFATPPTDDTGVAHILEHSVLCGSRRFPSKEPFVELMKSSLQSFLNAMTYPDRTVYPVASPNEADFYNLVAVYLDAVLHPKIADWAHAQEGWHIEVDEVEEGAPSTPPSTSSPPTTPAPPRLSYKGVVYNEMKGVYSNPDSLHAQACEAALFPQNPYSLSSGGDPLAIPSLTYAAFTGFHATHYHPSNARFWFFGDDDEARRLSTLAEYLEGFAAKPEARARSVIAVQPPFAAPVRVAVPYPVAASAGASGGEVTAPSSSAPVLSSTTTATTATTTLPGAPDAHFVTVTWGLPKLGAPASSPTPVPFPPSSPSTFQSHGHGDDVTRLGLGVLGHLLMGTQAATLRKALTDSALGSAVTGGGLDDSLVQPTFSAGLKGVKGADVGKVEALVTQALALAADKGFEADHVRASLNTVEFAMREFATGGGPRGLSLFLGVVPGWIYGRDPLSDLRFEGALAGLKAIVDAEGPGYFQRLVRVALLDNPHKAVVHSFPDPEWEAGRERVERGRLDALAASLSAEEVAQIRARQEQLAARQATPDPPEALAAIPTLRLSDLPREGARIAREVNALVSATGVEKDAVAAAALAPPGATVESAPAPVVFLGPAVIIAPPASASPASFTPPRSPPSVPSVLLSHHQPTSGVGYGKLVVDLSPLPQRLTPLLPLFAWSMTSTGTAARDEVALSRALGISTGGLSASVSAAEVPGHPSLAVPALSLSGKALAGGLHKMGELMLECITTARLDRRDRVAHFLRETVARHESGLVSAGHRYAGGVIGASLTKAAALGELWGGLTALQVARTLLPLTETDGLGFDALVADLEEVRAHVLAAARAGGVLATMTGDGKTLPLTRAALAAVVEGMAARAGVGAGVGAGGASGHHAPRFARGWACGPNDGSGVLGSPPSHLTVAGVAVPVTPEAALRAMAGGDELGSDAAEDAPPLGLVVPTQVNYVVRAGRLAGGAAAAATARRATGTPGAFSSSLSAAGGAHPPAAPLPSPSTFFPTTGGAEVVSAVLRTGYLWERVRVQGGAYGGFASLSHTSGALTFASYRDPHLGKTLETFEGAARHLREAASAPASSAEGAAFKDDLRKAVLSSIGGIDAPLSPSERGAVSASRYVAGVTDAMLQERREQVLDAGAASVEEFAAAAEHVASTGRVVVVGSEAAFAGATVKGRPFRLVRPLQKRAAELR